MNIVFPQIKSKKTGFLGAAVSLAVVYAACAAPVPLYAIYRQNIGLTNATLSMTAFAYFAGTITALLMFAKLSDFLGRRPVIFATLALSAVGLLCFMSLNNAPVFLAARFIQGVSCGLASSAITAYLADTAPEKPFWLGTVIISSAPNFGLAAGSFGSGAVVQYISGSLSAVYEILIVLLAACMVLIAFGVETVAREKGALSSLRPTVRAPKNIRKLLPAASAAFIGTWAMGGFYQAFSSSMAAEQFKTSNVVVAAAIFACMMAPNVIGSLLAGRIKSPIVPKLGFISFLVSVAVIIISLGNGFVIPFLLASICAGIFCGLTFTVSIQGIMKETNQKDRAGVLSIIYLISYSGAAIPNLIVGRISEMFNLFQISIGYGIWVAIACAIFLMATASQELKHTPQKAL